MASATERVSTRRTRPNGTVDEDASSTTESSAAGASAIVAASVSTTTAVHLPMESSRIALVRAAPPPPPADGEQPHRPRHLPTESAERGPDLAGNLPTPLIDIAAGE